MLNFFPFFQVSFTSLVPEKKKHLNSEEAIGILHVKWLNGAEEMHRHGRGKSLTVCDLAWSLFPLLSELVKRGEILNGLNILPTDTHTFSRKSLFHNIDSYLKELMMQLSSLKGSLSMEAELFLALSQTCFAF